MALKDVEKSDWKIPLSEYLRATIPSHQKTRLEQWAKRNNPPVSLSAAVRHFLDIGMAMADQKNYDALKSKGKDFETFLEMESKMDDLVSRIERLERINKFLKAEIQNMQRS